MIVTILGCGGSAGVPMVGGKWGNCDPDEPKNRRTRPSVLVETDDGARILVDTTPDLRSQLLMAEIDRIDAVLFTHVHADHVHGIDDLRAIFRLNGGKTIPAYGSAETMTTLTNRFAYLFKGAQEPPQALYRPVLVPHSIDASGESTTVASVEVMPFTQDHGIGTSWGFRIGDFGYSTDVVNLPDTAFEILNGVKVWVVDCLRDGDPHPTHAHLEKTLKWIDRLGPARAVLTHMNHQTDYQTIRARCPNGVEPGYDGMAIHI